MKLIDYMRQQNLDDDQMAEKIGEVTGHAVKKWKYGERTPDADTIARISRATRNAVAFEDWLSEPPTRRREAVS